MKICNDGTLQLNVPMKTSSVVIEDFIVAKYSWLLKNQWQSKNLKTQRQATYEEGEKHLYIGKNHSLKLISAKQSKVELNDENLIIYHRKNSSIKALLDKWYRQQALDYLTKRTHLFANSYNFPPVSQVTVRNMKARWGSCNSRSEITYNTHLIKATAENIDYVIIHELCHLLHPNHGTGFYRLQTQLNPYWKKQKQVLDQEGYRYIQ